MSLINEMLKDLEARGEPATRDAHVRAPVARIRRGGALPAAALATLVIAAVAVVAWLLWPSSDRPPAAVVASLNQSAAPPGVAQERVSQQLSPDPAIEPATAETISTPSGTATSVSVAEPVTTASAAPVAGSSDEPSDTPVVEEPRATTAPDNEQANSPEPVPSSESSPGARPPQTLIVRRHEPTPAEKALRAGRDGFAALQRSDWLAASRLLGELVALEPANDDAREGLAVALSRQGRVAEADSVLLDGLVQAVNPARFAKLRARLQFARGDAAGALGSLSVAVPAAAEDPEYHALKGAVAQQAGEYALAAATYRELTAIEPANATWQAGLGMAADALEDHTEARTAYRRALQAGGLEPALLQHVRQRLAALDRQ